MAVPQQWCSLIFEQIDGNYYFLKLMKGFHMLITCNLYCDTDKCFSHQQEFDDSNTEQARLENMSVFAYAYLRVKAYLEVQAASKTEKLRLRLQVCDTKFNLWFKQQ